MYNPWHLFSNSLLTTAVLNITHTHTQRYFFPQKTIFPEMNFNFRSLIGEKAEKGERIAEV